MGTMRNVEIFCTGTHTDSKGNTRSWTRADLQKIVDSYDPVKLEAPAVIGHPKETAPAYGWVSRVWLQGDILMADFGQVPPEFIKAVEEGRYKKRSISVDRHFRLQHVGFLGAVLPAVEGLKDIEFSAEAGMETYEFTTNEGAKPKEDDMTIEEALKKIDELKAALEASEAKVKEAEGKDREAEYKKQIDTANAKAKEAVDALNEYKKKAADSDLESRVDALIKNGKLLPADKNDTLAFARSMDGEGATMDFSREDGSTEKVSPRERYLRKLEAAEVNPMLSEFAKNGGSAADDGIDTGEVTSKI